MAQGPKFVAKTAAQSHPLRMVAEPGVDSMFSLDQTAMVAIAQELLPRGAQGLVESPQLLGVIVSGLEQGMTMKMGVRMKNASEKAEAAFQAMEGGLGQ